MDLIPTDHVDESIVVKNVYAPEDSTSTIDDPQLGSSTYILVMNTLIPCDIVNKLAE